MAFASSITIAWDQNDEPDIAAYRVYYGTESDAYSDSVSVEAVSGTSGRMAATIDGLTPGRDYFFAVKAIDEANQESDLSDQVSAVVPYDFDSVDLAGNLDNIDWLETGIASVSSEWTTINLARTFSSPVVIVSPSSSNDAEPCTVRIRNVTGNSFEVRIAEWEYLDGVHGEETVSWMVVEAGVYHMPDGTVWQAGTFELSGNKVFSQVSFPALFDTKPIIFQNVQTENDPDSVILRAKEVDVTGFKAALEEQESFNDGHSVETVGYLAVEKNLEGAQIIDTVTANHEAFTPDGVPGVYCRLEEEQSRDSETNHVNEEIGYMNIGELLFAQIQTYNGGDTSSMRIIKKSDSDLDPDWYLNEEWLEVGTLSLTHQWVTVNLQRTFSNPVVIAGPISYKGHDPSVIRIQNVTATSFDIRIQEWDYKDGWHTTENVSWMVMEAGTHALPDGTIWEAGLFELDGTNSWIDIAFENTFPMAPVVLQTVQTFTDEAAVTTRLKNISAGGFSVALQEEEAMNDGHGIETVGYVAVPLTSPVDVGLVHLNSAFTATQPWLPSIMVEEEKSRDSEVYHTFEDAGYLALGTHFFSTIQTFNGGDTAALRKE